MNPSRRQDRLSRAAARIWRSAWAGLALFFVPSPVSAVVSTVERRLAADGVLNSVSIELRPLNAGGGTRLVHRIHRLNGVIETRTIPGTDDPVVESDASLALSGEGAPSVLVWSRTEAGDAEIVYSIFKNGAWLAAPKVVTANGWDDKKPRALAGASGYVQVIWQGIVNPQATPLFYRTVIDSKGSTFLSPSEIVTQPVVTVTSSGASLNGLGGGDLLFAFDALQTTGPIRVVVFGGTDEPMPTIHRVDFVLSPASSGIDHVKVERVGSSVVLLMRFPANLTYFVGTASNWSGQRSLTIDSSMTEEAAEILIKTSVVSQPMP